MTIVKILLQVVGIIVLIPLVAFATLRVDNMDADGPSALFPGGELTSGELYQGPEPDWSFTDNFQTIELQTDDPLSSRVTFIIESDGKIYVPSGYMTSFIGRIWKDWAVYADEGDGLAAFRVDGKRYERRLVRIMDDPALDGVLAKMGTKYGGSPPREAVLNGSLWIFELAPRG